MQVRDSSSWGAPAAEAVPCPCGSRGRVHLPALQAQVGRAILVLYSRAARGVRVCRLWQVRGWFYCFGVKKYDTESILAHDSCLLDLVYLRAHPGMMFPFHMKCDKISKDS